MIKSHIVSDVNELKKQRKFAEQKVPLIEQRRVLPDDDPRNVPVQDETKCRSSES